MGRPAKVIEDEQLRLIPDAIGLKEAIEQMDFQIGEVQRILDRLQDAHTKLLGMADTPGLFVFQFTDRKTIFAGISLTLKL